MRNSTKPVGRFCVLTLVIIALSFLLAAAPALAQEDKDKLPEKTFKIIKEYPRTDAKSQGWTGTCWCFSTISFLESELMRLGKGEYELSEIFPVHLIYIEKAKAYVRTHGNNNFAQGALFHDALWAIKNYGIVCDSDYDGLWDYEDAHNHSELGRVLKAYLDAVIGSSRSGPSPKWLDGYKAVLDVYFGTLPETIEVDGKEMTPRQFAEDVLELDTDNYVEVTSFMHMPFYEQVELLIPDNWSHYDETYNVTLDELLEIMKYALNNGYTFAWGGDTSEETFNTRDVAYATWQEEEVVTQEEREKMWDNWKTTDDHGMHVVGLAEDEEGKLFFLTKNSHGKDRGPYEGHLYMSENYVRAKVDCILVHKDSIPAEIKAKLGLE